MWSFLPELPRLLNKIFGIPLVRGSLFNVLDKNNDGKLTRIEFAEAFDLLDANKDGTLSPSELQGKLHISSAPRHSRLLRLTLKANIPQQRCQIVWPSQMRRNFSARLHPSSLSTVWWTR